jgi:hypothetical protein
MLEIGIYVGVKVMLEKDHYMTDKMCRVEEDLKLTGEIDVEPGKINFPLGGLLLQALQFKFGPRGISF